MLSIILMTAACMVSMFCYRGNQIRQITCYSCIYLLALTAMKNMDFSFTIYLFFVMLSFMPIKRVLLFTVLYALYMGFYSVTGLMYQEFWTTASVLLTRYGFLFFGLLFVTKQNENGYFFITEGMFIVKCITFTEVLLAVYLLLYGDMENRLAINNQAIGGSLSVGLIPLLCSLYFENPKWWSKNRMYFYLAINLIVIILSGTRGYMVMAALTLIPIGFAWMQKRKNKGILILGILFAVILFVCSGDIRNEFISLLRLKESVGYRVYENRFIKEIFAISPWFFRIFGFGLGGRAEHLEGYYAVLTEAASGKDWMVHKLMTESTVHNYWYMILFKQGILGVILCGIAFLILLSQILKTCQTSKWTGWTLILMFIGVLISLTFRISATCGVWETMMMLWISDKRGMTDELDISD